MATAVVTGTSSGIGEAIARMLLDEGYTVIGISRRRGPIAEERFSHIPCDLSDDKATEAIRKTLLGHGDLKLLVNAAGFGRFEPRGEFSAQAITDMITLNLTAPILLTNMLLRSLKHHHGMIINITSIEATRHAEFSALYTATKAGLRAFGHTLFKEVRSAGVGIVTINPDMSDTAFFDDLRFGVGEREDTKLFAEDISQTVRHLLELREEISVTDLTIRPRRFGITKKPR